ncbi:hypothetical protein [Phaeocystidibacter marisrubri]|uniref:Outer membrane beta-barrel protein n=1 Tax=Phaeocystidibacter marisrubri TaxID=1577780 RepID=A0A6L3ZFY9_9FLAO|nr:hypothetical protein [Phaeocystidibacter marisrubri]KAB2815859.1 hypothetical protein F8C82_09175 [Phaeocystidibacter marisrubri]GGH66086.1 hypothetical protein GCM10011318_03700 [Phaeocystidibacter marisrubri]
MKKIGLILSLSLVGFFYSNTSKAQLVLQFGYENIFQGAYVGAGYIFADRVMLTGEVGLGSEFLIPKADLAVRFLRLRESELDFYIGAGYGYTFERIENVFPSYMYEGIVSMHYHGFIVGYALGFYDPTNPALSGVGDYHYFKIGVQFD